MLLIAYPFLFLISPYTPRQYRQPGVTSIRFPSDALPVRITRAGEPAPVTIEKVTANLAIIEGVPANDAFASIARSSIFVSKFFHAVFLCALFHLAWRLFQNMERRELFSARNLILVRRLSLALVCYAVIAKGVDAWRGWRIDRYVSEHLTFEGIKGFALPAPTRGPLEFLDAIARHGDFDFSLALTGLGALVLAEVFRRGLALQADAELTV